MLFFTFFRQPVLLSNGDMHEAELEARHYKMKQVIELYEDGEHVWQTERTCLRQANTEFKEANDKLRAELHDLTRNRDLLAQPLRREIEQLKIALGKERLAKAQVMRRNFHLQKQLIDISSVLDKHCDQVQLHMHELGAVMSRKRNYSSCASNNSTTDNDDGVATKRERSERSSSSSDDDLPPAFTGNDTPAAGSSVTGGRRALGLRRNCGVTSSSSVVPPPPSDLRNVDDSNNAEDIE